MAMPMRLAMEKKVRYKVYYSVKFIMILFRLRVRLVTCPASP